jgi:hypothetical protein
MEAAIAAWGSPGEIMATGTPETRIDSGSFIRSPLNRTGKGFAPVELNQV